MVGGNGKKRINCYNVRDIVITPAHINTSISQVKNNKSDGHKGFNSNHLINGSNRMNVLLSLLFKAMLTHGHYPTELVKSTIISIPKDTTASLSTSDNYDGISLFNSISKLFDYVIIYICEDMFVTSDMQFGFKSQHSTTMCTVIVREVVSHYLEGNSNIYCCLLDASKAFDRIHYGKLFSILLSKNMHPLVLRLLVNSYLYQKAKYHGVTICHSILL